MDERAEVVVRLTENALARRQELLSERKKVRREIASCEAALKVIDHLAVLYGLELSDPTADAERGAR